MELEELKNRWETLSRQLDRQQIVTRSLLEQTLCRRGEGLAAYSRLTIITGILAIPLLILIIHWRGLHFGAPVLIPAFAGMAAAILLEWRKLRLLARTRDLRASITEQERRFTAYLRAQRHAAIFSILFITVYVGWLLVRWYGLLVEAGRFGGLCLLLAGSLVAAFAIYKWEARRSRQLHNAIGELREFEAE